MLEDKYINELEEIERITLSHYEENAESFYLGTKDHDVSQNIKSFLSVFPKGKKLDILELGCGPGRDLSVFKSMGHIVTGLDGCEKFCKMAIEQSGCKILKQQFLKLDLQDNSYDGIFANASLFHVPSKELMRVLAELRSSLRKNGILFSSNPRGIEEGWHGKRFVNYMEFKTSQQVLENSGFKILHHYYRPEGKPRNEQPWLAIVSQRHDLNT